MVKFDERLCLNQLLKHLAYQKLLVAFTEKLNKTKAERPAKSTMLSILNDVHAKLVLEYKEISSHNDNGELVDSLGVLLSEACAEHVVWYLKQARDTLAMDICNMCVKPTKVGVKRSLKHLAEAECKLDFTKGVDFDE